MALSIFVSSECSRLTGEGWVVHKHSHSEHQSVEKDKKLLGMIVFDSCINGFFSEFQLNLGEICVCVLMLSNHWIL